MILTMTADKNPPILVVGATGNTGAQAVKKLHDRNAKVRILVRSQAKARELFGNTVEIYDGFDYDNSATAASALVGIDKMYLVSSYEPHWTTQTKLLVDAAKRAGVRQIVRLSLYGCTDTTKGFGASQSGKDHREVDEYIQANGFTYTFVRPTYFYQNIPWQHHEQLQHSYLSSPYGPDAKVNHIDTRDIAEVAAVVLTTDGHENKAYELTGPQSLSMAEMVAIISRLTRRNIQFVDMTYEESKAWITQFGISAERAEGLAYMYYQTRLGNTADVTNDVEKVTGHKGRTFFAYVKDNLQAFLPQN